MNGLSMPTTSTSNVLALPNTTQRSSPLSMPTTLPGAVSSANLPLPPPPLSQLQPPQQLPPKPPTSDHDSSTASAQPALPQPAADLPTVAVSPTDPPPTTEEATNPGNAPHPSAETASTRNAIILQNFDDNAIKDKTVQTQILFGRKMNRVSRAAVARQAPPVPLCVITNQPARYRDPQTGLRYHNAFAYREIRRVCRGDYRWSRLLGAWVGNGTLAAKGVPKRWLGKAEGGGEGGGDEDGGEDGAGGATAEVSSGADAGADAGAAVGAGAGDVAGAGAVAATDEADGPRGEDVKMEQAPQVLASQEAAT